MTLLAILLAIAIAVILMVTLGERFLRPLPADRQRSLQRWLVPLVGLALLLAVIEHYLGRAGS